MKPGYSFAAIVAVVALGSVAPVHAAKAPPVVSSASFTDSSIPGTVPFATLLSSDWEAGEGFVLGPLEPQNGYTASGVNSPWASIAALNPISGTRHLRIVFDAPAGAGAQRVALSPLVAVAPNSPSTTTQQIYITNDQGADYDFVGQAPSQALVAWRVKFSWTDAAGGGPGTIFILDNPGSGTQFVDTGVLWIQDAYTELKVQCDPGANQIRYFYDGVLIYTGVIYAANTVEQIVWVTDNFQLGGEFGDIDAVVLTDTPNDPVSANRTSWGQVKSRYR